MRFHIAMIESKLKFLQTINGPKDSEPKVKLTDIRRPNIRTLKLAWICWGNTKTKRSMKSTKCWLTQLRFSTHQQMPCLSGPHFSRRSHCIVNIGRATNRRVISTSTQNIIGYLLKVGTFGFKITRIASSNENGGLGTPDRSFKSSIPTWKRNKFMTKFKKKYWGKTDHCILSVLALKHEQLWSISTCLFYWPILDFEKIIKSLYGRKLWHVE